MPAFFRLFFPPLTQFTPNVYIIRVLNVHVDCTECAQQPFMDLTVCFVNLTLIARKCSALMINLFPLTLFVVYNKLRNEVLKQLYCWYFFIIHSWTGWLSGAGKNHGHPFDTLNTPHGSRSLRGCRRFALLFHKFLRLVLVARRAFIT